MKKKISILFLVVVTIGCLWLGIQTRKQNGIFVTQIQTQSAESLSYLVETKNHQLIMLDGGMEEDAEHLEQILLSKGGVVEAWFITLAHSQNFGALQKIVKNDKIQVNHIYISFNSSEWYQKHEPERYAETEKILDFIHSEAVLGKVQEIPNRFEVLIDHVYVTALQIKNPELTNYAAFNQSMIIKMNTTYKSLIFMGNLAKEGAQKFKLHNLDEIHCDALQISNNQQQAIDDEIYQKMTPQTLFMPVPEQTDKTKAKQEIERLKQKLKAKEAYLSSEGDKTVKIW